MPNINKSRTILVKNEKKSQNKIILSERFDQINSIKYLLVAFFVQILPRILYPPLLDPIAGVQHIRDVASIGASGYTLIGEASYCMCVCVSHRYAMAVRTILCRATCSLWTPV